jgi:hypothetical protein
VHPPAPSGSGSVSDRAAGGPLSHLSIVQLKRLIVRNQKALTALRNPSGVEVTQDQVDLTIGE